MDCCESLRKTVLFREGVTMTEYKDLTYDLAIVSGKASIYNAYNRNDLGIVSYRNCWWTEGCPRRIENTVYREMKKHFPELTYLGDLKPRP